MSDAIEVGKSYSPVIGKGYRPARYDGIDCRHPGLQVWEVDRQTGCGTWVNRASESPLGNYYYRVPIESDAAADNFHTLLPQPHRHPITVEEALDTLRVAMCTDSNLAWSWHCNVYTVAYDAGASRRESNERAADFMKRAFNVDIRETEEWRRFIATLDTVSPPCNDPTTEAVFQPAHYTLGPIECVDWVRLGLTAEEYRGWLKGNALAYIFRERGKGGDTDLDKASYFLTFHNRQPVNIHSKE